MQQALRLLAEARAIGELVDIPGPAKLTEIVDRSLALLDSVAKLRAENPDGVISADEVKTLAQDQPHRLH